MFFQNLLLVIVAVGGLIAGWYIVQRAMVRRKANLRRSEARAQLLITAYQNLLSVLGEGIKSREATQSFVTAMSIIWLLGTSEQIDTSRSIVDALQQAKRADFERLLMLVKDDVRKEFNLAESAYAGTRIAYEPSPKPDSEAHSQASL